MLLCVPIFVIAGISPSVFQEDSFIPSIIIPGFPCRAPRLCPPKDAPETTHPKRVSLLNEVGLRRWVSNQASL